MGRISIHRRPLERTRVTAVTPAVTPAVNTAVNTAVAPAPAVEVPEHDAALLTAGGATARICHLGQIYTLRITRQGKLILTK